MAVELSFYPVSYASLSILSFVQFALSSVNYCNVFKRSCNRVTEVLRTLKRIASKHQLAKLRTLYTDRLYYSSNEILNMDLVPRWRTIFEEHEVSTRT